MRPSRVPSAVVAVAVVIAATLLADVLGLSTAFAADAGADRRDVPVMQSIAKPAQPAPTTVLFAARRAGDKLLSAQRGGADVGGDNSMLGGVVSDNQAVNVTTGGNIIAGGAFAGASGVPVVIQNSGNNVLIQSSTIVNLHVK